MLNLGMLIKIITRYHFPPILLTKSKSLIACFIIGYGERGCSPYLIIFSHFFSCLVIFDWKVDIVNNIHWRDVWRVLILILAFQSLADHFELDFMLHKGGSVERFWCFLNPSNCGIQSPNCLPRGSCQSLRLDHFFVIVVCFCFIVVVF